MPTRSCPFCGSPKNRVHVHTTPHTFDATYAVVCMGCKLQTRYYTRESDAIWRWEHRTLDKRNVSDTVTTQPSATGAEMSLQ